MARTVDPERHEARRLHIIDAALTVFAERGYTGATTAAICGQADIGSGTFFHYFGTKLAVLLAILQLGIEETQQQARELEGRADPLEVLDEIVDRALADTTEPRLAGFVLAVGRVMGEPEVTRALATDDAAQHDLLRTWIDRAQNAGQIRTDMTAGAPRLLGAGVARWVPRARRDGRGVHRRARGRGAARRGASPAPRVRACPAVCRRWSRR